MSVLFSRPSFLSSFLYNSCMKIHIVLSLDFLKLAVITLLVLSHNHVTWKAFLKRNSDGALLLENSPKTEGMRRILHKRRKWGEPPVLGGRKEYSTWEATAELSLLKRNSSGILFLVDSTRGGNEEDSPFSEEKRSPPLEEDKIKVE